MKKIIRRILNIVGALLVGVIISCEAFTGAGTKEEPFLINNQADLLALASAVNSGEEYRGKWFRQERDIDLTGINWEPIGIFGGGHYFYGIYDGNGYALSHLEIHRKDNAGLFGQLGGTVMNLGIESGHIEGACTGAFSSHAAGSNALILNCYNKAEVRGGRAGGIADNFNGTIANCWTDAVISGTEGTGGIVSYTGLSIINCYSTQPLFPLGKALSSSSKRVENINTEDVATGLNLSAFERVPGISYHDINSWSVNDGKLQMDKHKQKFNLTSLAIANWYFFIPPGLLIVGIYALVLAYSRKSIH
mgnify:CR=1 FL=1